MKRLIVATDSNLRVSVAFVSSEASETKLKELFEKQGKSVLSWYVNEIDHIVLDGDKLMKSSASFNLIPLSLTR